MRWINKVLRWANLYLPALQLLVVVGGGVLGWLFVTRANQELNSARFAQSLTSYINTLKPSIRIQCNAFIQPNGIGVGQVYIENAGENLVGVKRIRREVVNISDGKSRGQWDIEGDELNPHAATQAPIWLSPPPGVPWDDLSFHGEAEIVTDDAVLSLAKSIVGNRLSVEQLRTLGTTKSTCTVEYHPKYPNEAPFRRINEES